MQASLYPTAVSTPVVFPPGNSIEFDLSAVRPFIDAKPGSTIPHADMRPTIYGGGAPAQGHVRLQFVPATPHGPFGVGTFPLATWNNILPPNVSLRANADYRTIQRWDKLVVRFVYPGVYEVSPVVENLKFIDLFAGIGGMRLAFEAVGGRCVLSSEIDPQARLTYGSNFGETPAGDVREIDAGAVPLHDVLVAGFPCQPFSVIGKREGFADTRGTLFYEIERILGVCQPRALLLENVKQLRTHDGGRTLKTILGSLDRLGYETHVDVLNALDYGVAQRRERIFIVGFLREALRDGRSGFHFPPASHWRPNLADVLEPDDAIDPSLWATQAIREKRRKQAAAQGKATPRPTIWHENKGGQLGIHPHSCAMRHNASHNYLLVNGERRMSDREMLRMQGFPESFRVVVPHRALREQCGNSVAVPVITAIAARIVTALRCSSMP